MIIKNRPEKWKGLYNGVGGKIELFDLGNDAMKREFREETGWTHPLPECSVDVLPETELYTGSNGIMYRQVYYIGLCKMEMSDVSIDPTNHVQVREVSAVAWCSLDDAIAKIRSTSPEKRLIIESIRTRWSAISSVHARADISLRHTEDVRTRSSHRSGGAKPTL